LFPDLLIRKEPGAPLQKWDATSLSNRLPASFGTFFCDQLSLSALGFSSSDFLLLTKLPALRAVFWFQVKRLQGVLSWHSYPSSVPLASHLVSRQAGSVWELCESILVLPETGFARLEKVAWFSPYEQTIHEVDESHPPVS